jgi:hypothetical protein
MQPLINQFTKNLAGCGGCGNSLSNPLWFKNKQEGQQMVYVIPIKITADDVKSAIAKLDGVDGEIMAVNPQPLQPVAVTQGKGSGQVFSRTTTAATPN